MTAPDHLLNYFTKCRFCLEEIPTQSQCIEIDRVLQEQFEELIGEIFNASEMLSTKICIDCQERLDESYCLKIKIIDSQKKLYQLLKNCNEITAELVHTSKMNVAETIQLIEIEVSTKPIKQELMESQDNKCPICGKYFKERRDITLHIERIHEQRRDYSCDLCSYRCYKKFDIILHHRNIHLKSSSSDTKVLCTECGRTMRNNSDLRRHQLKQHLRIKRFKCENCEFTSFEKSVMGIHSRTHLSLENRDVVFPCEICGKVLSTRNTLKAHINAVHENIRLHACPWCSKTFSQKSCLVKHQKSVHLLVRENQCDICHVYVSQACYLKKHKQMMHPPNGKKIKYPCSDCTQSFTTEQALKNHQKVHSDPEFSCEHCLKKFFRRSNLLDHMEHHETLAFPCKECKRSFRNESKLNHHLKVVHFKEKQTYRCEICSSTFTRRTTCRDHVLKQHKDIDVEYQKDLLERISKMLPEEKN